MSDSTSQIGNRQLEIGNPTAVWQRLRDSMDRLTAGRARSDPAALAEKLARRAQTLRGRMTTKESQPQSQYLTFSSGHERFGVLVSQVIEVQALEHYSPVPKTPPFIVGVIPWRGSILTLMDLGRLFGIPESGIADYHVCIVVEAAGRRLALVAREVEDLVGITAEQIKPVPELPSDASRDWLAGVYEGNRLLLSLEHILQDERLVRWKSEGS